ncbi:hypothetical protein GX586_09105 [bacterium]|nr:hypothetical protein [bacterium]
MNDRTDCRTDATAAACLDGAPIAPWQRIHHRFMNELILLSVELLEGGRAAHPALHGAAVHN